MLKIVIYYFILFFPIFYPKVRIYVKIYTSSFKNNFKIVFSHNITFPAIFNQNIKISSFMKKHYLLKVIYFLKRNIREKQIHFSFADSWCNGEIIIHPSWKTIIFVFQMKKKNKKRNSFFFTFSNIPIFNGTLLMTLDNFPVKNFSLFLKVRSKLVCSAS